MSNHGRFIEHAGRVRLDQALVIEERLREAQLGAAAALIAHASASDDPAQIVLPTGVGKSLVLTLAPYLLKAERALVVAPARLVRDQLAGGFQNLRLLKDAGVLPEDVPPPTAVVARHRATPEDWQEWQQADVVVGTVNVLSDGYPEVTRVPRDLFDLVLFDEAHHLPAVTWTRLLNAVDAPAVLLTATPFRGDGARLPGRVAFSYPLQRALERGVYAPVTYLPIHVGEGEDKNRALASKAKERLLSGEHRAADSRLLVRADRKEEASALRDLYEDKFDVPLGLVTGDSSARTVRGILERVRAGELLGFVCVGALIEGFDFPTLKIAAYHAPHRSLPATLQFLGRLSRVTSIAGELIADPRDLSPDTAVLYRRDPAWEELLPQILDSAVDREEETRRFLDEATGDTPSRIPWLAVSPPRSVRIYRMAQRPTLDLDLDRLGVGRVTQRLYQAESDLLAIVTDEPERPLFAKSTHLDRRAHLLHLATWVRDAGLLFISSDRPAVLRELLRRSGAEGMPLIGAEDLRRLLAATNASRFFSIGLRESRPRQAARASYETLAGRQADRAIAPEDAQNKLLGHAMGRAGSGAGTFGISTAKGKYWEPGRADSLFEFRQWCQECAASIARTGSITMPAGIRSIRIADRISAFPDHPLAAILHETLLDGSRLLVAASQRIQPIDVDVSVNKVADSQLSLELCLGDALLGTVVQHVDGTYEADSDLRVLETDTGELRAIDAVFEHAPTTVFFGDGSVVTGTSLGAPSADPTGSVPDFVLGVGWSDVDTRTEDGTPRPGLLNIQDGARERAAQASTWVVTDHGSGELADLVAITETGEAAEVSLLHCKGSSQPPGGRVEDLYEVVGQALRHVVWCRPGTVFWRELQRRVRDRSATSLVHGDPDVFAHTLETWSVGAAPATTFRVIVVQPALLQARTGTQRSVRALLLAAQSHCFALGADFVVWANDGS